MRNHPFVQTHSGLGSRTNFNGTLSYLYDPTIGDSGIFRPIQTSDFNTATITGNINIDDAIGITGGFIGINSGISAYNVSNSTVSGNNGNILPLNGNRKSFFIQSLGTGNVLYVKYGAGASSNSFNTILRPGTALDDGLGGTLTEDIQKGIISVSGISPRYIAFEQS